MTGNQIRQQFLDFFALNQHEIVASSPVVPHDDPTLMFTNAGMNQFKDVFLGTGTRPYVRAADTQKCIRAGGKHNDLDDVGQDTYHHTYFEMLGNWSFGDYFKKEAIAWAWELLTEVWGFEKDRLHATYFEGDEAEGLDPDSEAAELWRIVTDIDPSHIHPGNKKDNFWEMGDTGPCGPCSEIHVDMTPDKTGASLVNAGDPRVIELWNLVFIQFNRDAAGKLTPLPAKHVDTGMGFERLVAMLQGLEQGKLATTSNYDTDVFGPIFDAIQERTGAPAYCATLPPEPQALACANERTPMVPSETESSRTTEAPTETESSRTAEAPTEPESSRRLKPAAQGDCLPLLAKGGTQGEGGSERATTHEQVMIDVSYRVIADHIRCLTFALTDGAIPSNEGRGYVLRRILRRAVRYGRQYMNMHQPFLCDLVTPLVDHMADAFPELRSAHGGKNVEHVAEIIRDEEESFGKTLDRGIKLFNEAADHARKHHHGKLAGEDAFKLHDTYGFPIDLTELMAEEQGLTIDFGEYQRLMDDARTRARATTVTAHPKWIEFVRTRGETPFAGYTTLELSDAYVEGVYVGENLAGALRMEANQSGGLVLSKTPFYAEQGGQVGDQGVIRCEAEGWTFEVLDTKKVDRTFVHVGRCMQGTIRARNLPQGAFAQPNDIAKYPGRIDGLHHEPAPAHLKVYTNRRLPTMKNHTATHLLNWALREVLGDHVQQKGSLVDPEKTRFDFSHNKPVSDEELARIESLVNEKIEAGLTVYTKEVDQAKAREINTLRAVFGEKYPDRVRVVSIGAPIGEEGVKDADTLLGNPKDPKWMQYSVEFCGGTHLKNTSEAERFVLTAEEGVAKGIRRVVGVSGDAARAANAAGLAMIGLVNYRTKEPGDDLATWLPVFQGNFNEAVIPLTARHQLRERIAALQETVKKEQKQAASVSGEAAMDAVGKLFESAEAVNGVTIVVGEVPLAGPDALRGAIDWVRNKTEASAVFLVTSSDEKVTLIAGMSKSVVKQGIKAGDLIKVISPIVGGRGGGRPDMAQGGGNDPSAIPQAIERAKAWLSEKL